MNLYPINLDLVKKNVLVVGGGKVAYRKLERLLTTKANITLVSPKLNQAVQKLIVKEEIIYYQREFITADITDKFLAFAATDDRAVNQQISKVAKVNNTLVNVVDSKEESDFTLPAVISQGALLLAISSGGNLPALSRVIKEELVAQFSQEYAIFLEIMEELRPLILNEIKDEDQRRELFRRLADLELIKSLSTDKNKALVKLKEYLPSQIRRVIDERVSYRNAQE
ncbi:siroheme synthase, N-terminal domain protein [Halobacteroides halobius DSM 5150]|uniref:precorrin-2 dehydrogenase n=1 Tax=Halobacteroides halobius (strain ATCC 35273 / DSM 5150 / MD-1) TaxID=748449 RepID=L0K852_HALHC|nr:bifunctional precorrin-2 dehydrogenase/sirohydrochlorin ferrochelatase [Halobacteroides halobius]AGB41201.1 siroheme synthase, N-terminal domain protein [Halobacteroides halobius DSM 5150]